MLISGAGGQLWPLYDLIYVKYQEWCLKTLLFSPQFHVQLFATAWTAAHHTSLSFIPSKSLLRLMYIDLPGGTSDKESACNVGDVRDTGSIPGSIRSTGVGHGNPLQHSCLENPIDIGTWWATVHRVVNSHKQLMWLSTHACPLSRWCYWTISSSANPFSSYPQSFPLLDLHSKINH